MLEPTARHRWGKGRRERVAVRLDADERAEVERAAVAEGLPFSTWVRRVVVEEARKADNGIDRREPQ